ncbi:hypothetical protein C2I18_09705 [Paenibacillus sp. PK3_47]|uniref:glycosyltransferase n=1 Tax=Paenibacillus sp. PK3_47 TaxID=2072642 RepID=UPI00201E5F28|nr:glycosyltransferase [Paenibacillus sp. PK3_47]UQZ33775.1 hypothetical protein C2I18_09705 [Paenibacillus sp. PK3_47]
MAGPSIRYYNFYLELSKQHEVRILLSELNGFTEKLPCELLTRKSLNYQLQWCDIVITQGLTLFYYPKLKKVNKILVIDLYDPFILENLEIRPNNFLGSSLYNVDLRILKEQIMQGDYFICSNERQMDFWVGILAISGAVDVENYAQRKRIADTIGLVPFGIPNENPEATTPHILRENTPGFHNDDFIVIWSGGTWGWLDLDTVIDAFALLKEANPRVKLYIMGGQQNDKLKEKCEKKGVLNKNVFLGNWVPYNERQNYLLDSDIGLVTHFDSLETRYSHRTRVLDYIWCELPVVSTKGDYLTDELIVNMKCGVSIEYTNSDQLAAVILKLANDDATISKFSSNMASIKNDLRWQVVMKDLMEYCSSPYKVKKHKENFLLRTCDTVIYKAKKTIYHLKNKIKR